MKKFLIMSGVCAMTAFASQAALAEVKVRAGAASTAYKLDGDYITAESKYTPLSLGLSFNAENGFYVDLAYSGGTGEHDGYTALGKPAEDFERTDLALIFGKSWIGETGKAGTFFGGLKQGKTTVSAKNVGLSYTKDDFETAGLVLGGGASFPIAEGAAGAVGVKAGLGFMGGKWSDDAGFSADADFTLGFSFGVNYTYPFTSNFGMVIDYNYNKYSYTFDADTTPFEVNETIGALGATLYAKF